MAAEETGNSLKRFWELPTIIFDLVGEDVTIVMLDLTFDV
jgi:hypothetical protein